MSEGRPGEDVRRVSLDGRAFTVRYHGPGAVFDQSAVTSASVTAFMADGRLVLAMLAHGPDLPGGHISTGDRSPEDTVRREAMEEAGLRLGPLKLSCVIESDYFGPTELTYMLNYAAWVDEFLDVPMQFESSGRVVLTVEEYLNRYAGDAAGMTLILGYAQAALGILRDGRL